MSLMDFSAVTIAFCTVREKLMIHERHTGTTPVYTHTVFPSLWCNCVLCICVQMKSLCTHGRGLEPHKHMNCGYVYG